MSRAAWMDKPHEYREDRNDYSMCRCDVPLQYHYRYEQHQQALQIQQNGTQTMNHHVV